MAKKIRFALDMGNGIEVTDLEGLKTNFNVGKVKEYFEDGRLQTWLESRYYDEELDALESLSSNEASLGAKLCEIFGVEYSGDEEERRQLVREYTEDENILDNIHKVAFNQDELADLLDDGEKTIYLLGKEFSIPTRVHGVEYIGINTPSVRYKLKEGTTLTQCGISFVNVKDDVKNKGEVLEKASTGSFSTILKDAEEYDSKKFFFEKENEEDDYVDQLFYAGEEEEICISRMGTGTTIDFCCSDKYVFYIKCGVYEYENSHNPDVEVYRYDKRTKESKLLTTVNIYNIKDDAYVNIAYLEDAQDERYRYMHYSSGWLYVFADQWNTEGMKIHRIKEDGSKVSVIEAKANLYPSGDFEKPNMSNMGRMGGARGIYACWGDRLFLFMDNAPLLSNVKVRVAYSYNLKTRKCLPVCYELVYAYFDIDCAYFLVQTYKEDKSAIYKMEKDSDELIPLGRIDEKCMKLVKKNGEICAMTARGKVEKTVEDKNLSSWM